MKYEWKDFYYNKAKEEGFKSRAAYKLIEINNKHQILKRGRAVLDLGCAPGGWLQIVLNSVGKEGSVIGVDKTKFEFPQRNNLKILTLDIEDENDRGNFLKEIEKKFDVILSDMAPKISGIRDADNARMRSLWEISLELCRSLLKPKGDLLIKAFHSNELNEFKKSLAKYFEKINLIVPEAKRRSSSETYILARGFRKDL